MSLGDWLDDEAPIEWLADMLDVIRRCPKLDFLLLTKRPENWEKRMLAIVDSIVNNPREQNRKLATDLEVFVHSWVLGNEPSNVWIGTTVENHEYADRRIPELLKIPAVCRFVSYEPALGPVDFNLVDEICCCGEARRGYHDNHNYTPMIVGPPLVDWIIVGGESGSKARPFNVEWARSTVAQCKAASVACFVKQLGAKPIDETRPIHARLGDGIEYTSRLFFSDKKGGDITEWPADLRVREFPTINS